MLEQRTRTNRLCVFGIAVCSTLLLCVAVSAATPSAVTTAAPSGQTAAPTVTNSTPTDAADSDSQSLHLLVGRSLVITSPTRITRVSLADPAIVEAVVVSPHQIVLNGKSPGSVSLLVWDDSGQSQSFEVSVDLDVLKLSQIIQETFPAEKVTVQSSKDVVLLSGHVSSVAVASKILEFVKSTTPKVASALQVPLPPQGQILLQVRFAEVDRTAISQLGLNILSLPGAKNVGTISTQQFGPPQLVGGSQNGVSSNIGVSDLLNIFIFRPDINLAATIKALQENNVLQILAEPNLLTESGKEASFLAGGEFPYPILQSTTGGGFAGITIQFKEFGVRLNFTPTLTSDGLIHLKVQPEVSALDFSQALTIQGFLIPALSTRRVQSEMNLGDGQSFAIAGLVDNRLTEQFQKIPWIGSVPVLGKLFQSRTLNKSRNELLVVVTPRLVQPLAPGNVAAGPTFPKTFLEPVPSTHPSPAAK